MPNRFRWLFGMLPLAFTLACGRLDPPGPKQPLLVGLPNDPVFQQAASPGEGMDGFSRDLARLFAETLNAEVRFVTAPDYPALRTMAKKGEIHLAAPLPALMDEPELRYSTPLHETRQIIVKHESALPLESPDRLAEREIALLPGAPQFQTIRKLSLVPPPVLQERVGSNEIDLLADVAQRRIDLAASDELHFSVATNFHPELDIAVDLPDKLAFVWAFPFNNPDLLQRATRFIDEARQNGTLRRLNDRYFGHIHRLTPNDVATFLEFMRTRLPNFRHLFQEAQEITGIDWRLIAALAYQESKWDPLAISPTSVRGMMMLTEDTADRLKVTNRLDAGQSIRAGAKYLLLLLDELPEDIQHPDRLWFALAAYNLGMGHLGGARAFAPSLKRDPNLWVDMKKVLPLMALPEYYSRLKSGPARGGEAVILVENIRNYYDVLSRFEPAHESTRLGSRTGRLPAEQQPAHNRSASRR